MHGILLRTHSSRRCCMVLASATTTTSSKPSHRDLRSSPSLLLNRSWSSSRQVISPLSSSSYKIAQQLPPPVKLPSTTITTTRHMAAATKEKKQRKSDAATKDEEQEPTLGYWEQKKLAKERRRELYTARVERKERLKVRRHNKPQDEKKIAFQQFFIRKKVNDEYMDRKARQMGYNWKIRVAAIVERIHVVQPDKQDWEREYDTLRAHLNLYGKIYPKELIGEFDWNAQRPMTDEELLASLPFTPAPRETEADRMNDVHSLERKLKTKLYLSVLAPTTTATTKMADDTTTTTSNNTMQWQFPTVDVRMKNDNDNDEYEEETLLDAAKRALTETVGPNVEYWCPSNAPWTVDVRPYTDVQQQQTLRQYGIKTFFIKVQHDEGNVLTNDMTVKDYAWLDRDEMVDRVRQQQGDFLSKFYYYML